MKASDYTKAKKGWIASFESWYTVSIPGCDIDPQEGKRGDLEALMLTYRLGEKRCKETVPMHNIVLMQKQPDGKHTVSFTRAENTAEFVLAEPPELHDSGMLRLVRHPDKAVFYSHPCRSHFRQK